MHIDFTGCNTRRSELRPAENKESQAIDFDCAAHAVCVDSKAFIFDAGGRNKERNFNNWGIKYVNTKIVMHHCPKKKH
jgi:hypothetical protein